MTGTDGARILAFQRPDSSGRPSATGSNPEPATGSNSASAVSSNSTFATGSRSAATIVGARFKSLAARVTWRPKTTVKNADYPRVTAPGCYFNSDSGGFALTHRATNKYLGHYTRNAIAELERKYGKKNSKRTHSR
jgi:hypothetical protein